LILAQSVFLDGTKIVLPLPLLDYLLEEMGSEWELKPEMMEILEEEMDEPQTVQLLKQDGSELEVMEGEMLALNEQQDFIKTMQLFQHSEYHAEEIVEELGLKHVIMEVQQGLEDAVLIAPQ